MKILPVCSAIILAVIPGSVCHGESAIPNKPPLGLRFTLAEAEAYALQNHPQIASAQLTADAVRQEIRQARSAFFPQIYGESTSVYAPYDTESSSATRLAALGGLNNPTVYSRQSDGVVLNQLITDFGHTYDLTESARFRANAASDRVNVARAIIILEVDRTYFDVLRAQAVLQVAQETVKTRQVAVDQVSVLVKNQLKSTLDESFDQVALSQAKLLLIQAQSGVQEAEAALSTALGFQDAQHFTLAEVPLNLELPKSVDDLVQLGLNKRPELAALRHEVEAAQRFAQAQQAAEYPKVTALAAAGLSPVADDKLLNHNYYAAGVNVEIPLATGGNLDAKTEEARLVKRAADNDVIDAQNTISRDVRVAWLNLGTDKERIGVTDELIKNAAESQRLAAARYRLGTSSIVEFTQAELNYTEAELEAANAKYDYQSARALLNFTTGGSF
ncbi:MAG TPA: TolC family protein [Candidatus Methylacidiphilales bacterium]|jgi:outer membrane protein|nr:TolC family protein [Candidatus Methylacidiphilales bacterium]